MQTRSASVRVKEGLSLQNGNYMECAMTSATTFGGDKTTRCRVLFVNYMEVESEH